MRRLFFGLAFLLGAAGAQAQPAHEVASYQLDNGLKVALAPDSSVPKVVLYLRYRVGAMNEPPGRSGFAHLFEHLMFSGTPAWPDYDRALLATGNRNNAWTSQDATVYWVEGVAANLPMILSIEADRMANLGGDVDRNELDVQRAVVKNEMRQNVLDKAGMAGWWAVWTGLFPKEHPYSRSVIGSMADLDEASLEDVRGFFNTYYLPNNAVLSIVGDFDVDEVKALIDETFGKVPRGPEVAMPSAPDAPPAAIRVEIEDRLPYPWVMLAHSGPRDGAAENGALKIAAEIMGNGEYGFLRQRLVADKALGSAVYVDWTPGLLGGRFTVSISALPGVSAETLEEELKAAVADFLAVPLDPADVERARRTLLLNARLEVEAYNERGKAIAYAADLLGDPGAALADDPQIAGAAVAEIEAAARAVLDPETASVLVVRPGARGDYPAVLTESSGEPQPFAAPDRAAVDVPALGASEPRDAEPPARAEAVLSNGAKLVHYRLPSSPMAYVGVVGDGGWDNAPPGKEGLLQMAAGMAYRGAGGRDFSAFAKAAKDIGADISYSTELTGTGVTLSVPGDRFGEGAALLADAVLRPLFDESEWRQAVAYRLDQIAWDETSLSSQAWSAAGDELMPATATEPGTRWKAEAVEAMTLDEAKAAYARLFQPSASTVVSVGPLTLEEVAEGLDKAFAGWRDTEPGFARKARRAATFPDAMRVMFVPEPGASQSAIHVLRPAPGFAEDAAARATAVVRLLGGDFLSRLNSVIREEKGYSYGVGGSVLGTIGVGSALYISAPVDRDHTGAALAEIFAGFESLEKTPPAQNELDRTVSAYRMALAGIAETGSGLFSTVLSSDGIGETLEDYYARLHTVVDLDLEDVRAQALALASLERSYVAIAGDPDSVLPQLAELGLDVEVLAKGDDTASRSAADLLAPPPGEPLAATADDRTPGRCLAGVECEVQP